MSSTIEIEAPIGARAPHYHREVFALTEFQHELQLRVDDTLASVEDARCLGDEDLAQAHLGELHNLIELAHDNGIVLRLSGLTLSVA